jgi:hypothetical protein
MQVAALLEPYLHALRSPTPHQHASPLPTACNPLVHACKHAPSPPPFPSDPCHAGGVGSGRNFIAGTAELHIPLVAPFEGTIFGDYGTDLESGHSVLGDPAGSRNKPGNGFGGGLGVRMQTPIGPLRLEYGINDRQQGRFHLGIGSHG